MIRSVLRPKQGTRINSLSKTDLIHRSFCQPIGRRRNLCSVQSLALWGGEAEQAALVKIGISIEKKTFHSTVLERERI